ncbi:unnamed protein product [Aphis gossypii]|uniref:Uncharacterized protein n=1 Tax=Aphis gossypii TaxID=80765 RepID=A0A9P0IUA9_APHGO|nr:unnamed protein product [Aphis gossypii]
MEAGIKAFCYCVNQLFYTVVHGNVGLQIAYNVYDNIISNNKKDEVVRSEDIEGYRRDKTIKEILKFIGDENNKGLQTAYNADNSISNNTKKNTEDTSNTVLKKNKQKKELKKKDEVVRSEDIKGYRGDKTIEEILKFIGDESGDSKKNKDCKIKNKIKSPNEKSSDNDCNRPKNDEMKMSIYNSIEEVSTTIFQPIDSLDNESKLIKSIKKGKKVPKQNQSSEKFTSTEQTLDVLSSKPQDTESADFLLVTKNQKRRKQKSQNKLNTITSNFPIQDSNLLSPYIQPKSVKNEKKRKSTSSMPHSNKSEDNSNLDSVHSLLASSTLSKQPSYKEASKTDMTKPVSVVIMYNEYEVDESLSFGFEVDQNLLIDSVNDYSPKRKSQNKLNTITSNFPTQDSNLLSPYTQLKSVKNEKKRKSTSSMPHSNKSEDNSNLDSVHSLLASSTLSKQPSYKEASKTDMTKPVSVVIMYNEYEVDESLSFGFEVDQNLLIDSVNDYSPKRKSQNKLNTITSNFPTQDSNLLSPYTQPKSVKNEKKRKSTSSMPHSNKSEDNSNLDSVHSLLASSTLSKQPSYKEASKTDMTKPVSVVIMYNEYEVDESLSFGFEVDQNLLIDSVNDYSPKRKSQNKLNTITSNFPTQDSNLLSPYTQPKSVKNEKKRKSTSSMAHSNKSEDNSNLDTVHSLLASSTLSKQPSYKEASKTDMTKPVSVVIMYNEYEVDESLSFGFEVDQNLLIDSVNDYSPSISMPTPTENNYEEVVLSVKQAWQDVEKEKIDGINGKS